MKHYARAACVFVQVGVCVGAVYLKSTITSQGDRFHAVVFAFYRELLAASILLLTVGVSGQPLPERGDRQAFVVLGLLLYANQLFYILGVQMSGVVVASCMQPVIPVFTAALACFLGYEVATVQKLLGTSLAVAGAVTMVVGGFSGTGTGGQLPPAAEEGAIAVARAAPAVGGGWEMVQGNVSLFLNTVAMALYYVRAKVLLGNYAPICVAAFAYIVAAMCMGVTAVATTVQDSRGWSLPAEAYGPLAYWVVVGSVIGYSLLAWASTQLPASQVAAFQCLQPFVGMLLAVLLLDERPRWCDLGAIAIVFGLATVVRDTTEHTSGGKSPVAKASSSPRRPRPVQDRNRSVQDRSRSALRSLLSEPSSYLALTPLVLHQRHGQQPGGE